MHPSQPTNPTVTEPSVNFDQGGSLTSRPSGVGCPKCRTELVIGEIQGSQFAGCQSCHGMLMQQTVFSMLIQHLRANMLADEKTPKPLDTAQLQVKRLCPTCDHKMETHPYGGPGNSVIDTCIRCGLVWFDQGELNVLVRAPGRR